MNNKIIWVFGPSAVGKETFIKYINDNKPEELLTRLGWVNKDVVICNESLDWVAHEDGDKNELLRKKLDKVIEEYSKKNTNSIILIKGQDLDFDNNTLNKVKESLQNDEHEIIFLYVDFDILYKRYVSKKWWNETMTKGVCKDWAKEQINFLVTHQNNGFKIKALDSSSNEYLDNDFPPAL
ncbi:MAG: hypothetical protein WAW11_05065 [Patescibacteria group bacterium]